MVTIGRDGRVQRIYWTGYDRGREIRNLAVLVPGSSVTRRSGGSESRNADIGGPAS